MGRWIDRVGGSSRVRGCNIVRDVQAARVDPNVDLEVGVTSCGARRITHWTEEIQNGTDRTREVAARRC